MTEFAVLLPVLALILFAIFQLGITFNHYLALTDAVRAGARTAAVSRKATNPCTVTQNKVRASAVDLDQTKLTVPCPTSTWAPGADVTVTASYPYSISLLGLVVKSGNLTSTVTERVE